MSPSEIIGWMTRHPEFRVVVSRGGDVVLESEGYQLVIGKMGVWEAVLDEGYVAARVWERGR